MSTPSAAPQVEGLRERKKREMRQRISDTATRLFLRDGYDAVTLGAVALASDVSEKTVYNYFATKESLVLDREPALVDLVGTAFGPESPFPSPIAAMQELIGRQVEHLLARSGPIGHDLGPLLSFLDMIEGSPALMAARRRLDDRLAQLIATALAERVDGDAMDPEPQGAAYALMSLWVVALQALRRQVHLGAGPAAARAAVDADLARAARVLDGGLASWALVTIAVRDETSVNGAPSGPAPAPPRSRSPARR